MNAKRNRFVAEYLIDLNATQAYIRAGYSPNGAAQSAAKLLTNTEIVAAIAERRRQAAERAELSVDWVLRELRETYAHARGSGQLGTAHASLVSLGKHIGMWPNKLTITDADKEAAHVAAEKLGLDEADVLAEVERELREAKT